MPETTIKQKFELSTRNEFTKAECEVIIILDGKELPSMGVQGDALEAMLVTLREKIKASYATVPTRIS